MILDSKRCLRQDRQAPMISYLQVFNLTQTTLEWKSASGMGIKPTQIYRPYTNFYFLNALDNTHFIVQGLSDLSDT